MTKGGQDAGSPLRIEPKDRIEYHKLEFGALKAEIAELVKQTTTLFTYAITASGAVVVWLLTKPEAEPVVELARWLPILFSGLFGLLALVSYVRIGEKAAYIQELEEHFAVEGLGWERTFRARPSRIFWLQTLAWGILNLCNLVVALLLEFPAAR